MKSYLTKCRTCGATTNTRYAAQHDGQCKACATGEAPARRRSASAEEQHGRYLDAGHSAWAHERGDYDTND